MTVYDGRYEGDVNGQDMSGDTLSGTFIEVDFSGKILRDAILSGTFIDCVFSCADLTGAYFPRESWFSNTLTCAIMPDGTRYKEEE